MSTQDDVLRTVAQTTTEAEYRQALALSCADALACTRDLDGKALFAIKTLLRRLARSDPFDAGEEGEWLRFLMNSGCVLTPPFDADRWKL